MLLRPGTVAPLDSWHERPFSPGSTSGPDRFSHQDCYEREVGAEPPGEPVPDGPYSRCAGAILRYDIFPPDVVRGVLGREPVKPGDVVGIRFLGFRWIHLFFAARVLNVFGGLARNDEGASRPLHRTEEVRPECGYTTGFTYRTLAGHPELGEETFAVEKRDDGRVWVTLRSWSRPGLWLTRLGWPIARWWQRRASHRALDWLEGMARSG